MAIFGTTVGATLGLLIIASIGLSWVNAQTIQQVVNRTGKANSQLWLMKPGILVHETLHALVALGFGVKVTGFSLRPDQRAAAHVDLRYQRHSWWQRLGISLASIAPLWGISALLLILGKKAWFPSVSWASLGFDQLRPNWLGVAGWLVVCCLLTFGASLSRQDFHNALVGLPVLVIGLGGIFVGLWLLAPAWLVSWQRLNGLFAALVAAMLIIAVVVNRLVAI